MRPRRTGSSTRGPELERRASSDPAPDAVRAPQDDRGRLRRPGGILRARRHGRPRRLRPHFDRLGGVPRHPRLHHPDVRDAAPAGAAGHVTRPRILVTNDDGIFSEGIERLAEALTPVGEVFTVAPDQERSAAGHSLTLQSPLRAKLVGPNRWSVDGTPTDCVNWGVLHLMKDERPRLVVSGINLGLNLGDDVTY